MEHIKTRDELVRAARAQAAMNVFFGRPLAMLQLNDRRGYL